MLQTPWVSERAQERAASGFAGVTAQKRPDYDDEDEDECQKSPPGEVEADHPRRIPRQQPSIGQGQRPPRFAALEHLGLG